MFPRIWQIRDHQLEQIETAFIRRDQRQCKKQRLVFCGSFNQFFFRDFECARKFAERYLGKRLEYPARCSLILDIRRKFKFERGALPEVGVGRGHRPAREGLAAGDDLVDVRVTQKEAQELAARISGGADNSSFHLAALATSRT